MKYPLWYHPDCLFQAFKVHSIDHIENFETIAYEDQMDIMKKIDANFKYDEIADRRRNVADNPNALKNFGVESMTIDRGSCFSCKEQFEMGDVIVMKIVFDSQAASKYGRDVKWNHLGCFSDRRDFLGYPLSGCSFPGFGKLHEDDKDLVRCCLP